MPQPLMAHRWSLVAQGILLELVKSVESLVQNELSFVNCPTEIEMHLKGSKKCKRLKRDLSLEEEGIIF